MCRPVRLKSGSDLVLMIDGMSYVVVETIQASHDGRRDPRWNEKLGYASGDDWLKGLTNHGWKSIIFERRLRSTRMTGMKEGPEMEA